MRHAFCGFFVTCPPPIFLTHRGMKKWERHRQACLCLGLFRVLKKSGQGEPFGKASLANTVFRLGRFISMRDRSSWTGEGWYRYPSNAWPDEALEKGLPRPLAKSGKKWEAIFCKG